MPIYLSGGWKYLDGTFQTDTMAYPVFIRWHCASSCAFSNRQIVCRRSCTVCRWKVSHQCGWTCASSGYLRLRTCNCTRCSERASLHSLPVQGEIRPPMEISMGHGIFHGPWKFPWALEISRTWNFPWAMEISSGIFIWWAWNTFNLWMVWKLSLSKKD